MTARKPKLGLITTGGTIGMVRDADGLARPPKDGEDFAALLGPLSACYDINIVALPPRDSTDMTPVHWNDLREDMAELRRAGAEGFVITHGTDTMAYAAAMMAFTMGPPPLPQPVVFTGAQRTPEAEDYDGARNLADACAVAASELGEVAVVFHGRILRGCRVEKVSLDDLDAFRSPEPPGLGRVTDDGKVGLHDDAARRGISVLDPLWSDGVGPTPWVLSVALSPGISTAAYLQTLENSHRCEGVIVQGFGPGHAPASTGGDWVSFIRRATELDIPVLLTSPLGSGWGRPGDYAVGRAALDAGAIPLQGMVTPAAEIKFRGLIAAAIDLKRPKVPFVREQMAATLYGERCVSSADSSTGI